MEEKLKIKIQEIIKILNRGLVGKEKVIKLGLLSVLAGENLILVGPPGTAKSEISRRLTKVFRDESYFEYLLTKFTTPEEIFGPLSIKKLQEDKFERNVEGYIPTSRIVFLDEIFKANSSILNTLLTLVNERVFHNGVKREKVKLLSLIGASNELPFGNDELTALYDRFLIREVVGYVDDEEIESLLDVENEEIEIDEELKITDEEIAEIREGAKNVRMSESVRKSIIDIRNEYNRTFMNEKYEVISDRKLVKIVKLLKTSAYLNGRGSVDFSDLVLLSSCLWNSTENIETVTKIVLNAVKRNITGSEEQNDY